MEEKKKHPTNTTGIPKCQRSQEDDDESRCLFTGRSLTKHRIFGVHAFTRLQVKTPRNSETLSRLFLKFFPFLFFLFFFLSFYKTTSRHGGIYVSTRQVSHFMILGEQLRGEILKAVCAVSESGGGGMRWARRATWTQIIRLACFFCFFFSC